MEEFKRPTIQDVEVGETVLFRREKCLIIGKTQRTLTIKTSYSTVKLSFNSKNARLADEGIFKIQE